MDERHDLYAVNRNWRTTVFTFGFSVDLLTIDWDIWAKVELRINFFVAVDCLLVQTVPQIVRFNTFQCKLLIYHDYLSPIVCLLLTMKSNFEFLFHSLTGTQRNPTLSTANNFRHKHDTEFGSNKWISDIIFDICHGVRYIYFSTCFELHCNVFFHSVIETCHVTWSMIHFRVHEKNEDRCSTFLWTLAIAKAMVTVWSVNGKATIKMPGCLSFW